MNCQVCVFVHQTEDSVVRRLSIHDIISANARLPYTNRSAWHAIQSESSDLRRTHAHLSQGTRPSKKQTNVKDIKRYLNVATIARDGLLVVKRIEPLMPTRECIVVPREVIDGLITALHIQLDNPSCHQLKLVTFRHFYALDMDKCIEQATNSCHQCSSLSKVPHTLAKQSTSDPPDAVGVSFAADVMKRERQLIFVIRECVTSYTTGCIIEDERSETLRSALIRMCLSVCLCLFVCLYVCLSMSVCVCLCLSVCVCLSGWLYMSVCVCLYLCMSVSVCVCLSVSVCICVCICRGSGM